MRINLGVNKDGVRTGYMTEVEALPRVGDKITLIDTDAIEGGTVGEESKLVVTEVRHVLFYRKVTAGGHTIEVETVTEV